MDRLRDTLAAHPSPVSTAGDEVLACVYEAAQCALVCTACADACLAEEMPENNRECIRLCVECAELCGVVARLLVRAGRQDPEALDGALGACSRACRACAEACGRHADRMAHCRHCAEACNACADACESMRGALVP